MISKLKLINLTVREDNLEKLLDSFVDFTGFHPADPNKIIATVHGARSYEGANPCEPLLEEIKQIE
ncbi:MAG: hypothetical protein WC201_03880, partial [Bacilli bacterium]